MALPTIDPIPFFALLLVGVLPGIPWAYVLAPYRMELSRRLSLAIVASLANAVSVGLICTSAHAFAAPNIALGLSLGGLLGLGALALHRRARVLPPQEIRAAVMSRANWIVGLLLSIPVWAHALRQHQQPWRESRVAWYYLGDILEIVYQRAIPSLVIDHGMPMAFEINKISWYLPVAEWTSLVGPSRHPMFLMESMVLATVAAFALGAWLFMRELIHTRAIAVFASLTLTLAPRLIWKVGGFRGEGFGIMLMSLALWLVHRALREGGWRWHLWTSLSMALLVTSHLVPGVVLIFWYGVVAIAQWIRSGRGFLPQIPRVAGSTALAVILVAGVFSAAGSHTGRGQSALMNPSALKPYHGYDPTAAFVHLVEGKSLSRKVAKFRDGADERFHVPPDRLFRQLLKWVDTPIWFWPRGRDKLALPFYLFVMALIWRRGAQARILGVAFPLLFVLLYLWALFFSWRYHTYLPANHPSRREFAYLQFFLVPCIAASLEIGLQALRDRLADPIRQRAVIGLAAVVLTIGPARAAYKAFTSVKTLRLIRGEGRHALAWLRKNTPRDARILLDGPTDGIVRVLAQRTAVLEGRAPYFQPENLSRVLDLIRRAGLYFRTPSDVEWLYEQQIDYVVTGAVTFGARPFAHATLSRRRSPPQLDLVAHFGSVRIYRVRKRNATLPANGQSAPAARERSERTAARRSHPDTYRSPSPSPMRAEQAAVEDAGDEHALMEPDLGAAADLTPQ